MAKILAAMTAYLLVLATMITLVEPQGRSWMLAAAGAGLASGGVALWLVKRASA